MVWLPVGPRVFRRDFRFFARGSLPNLLGARLAINVILSGHGGSLEDHNQAMDAALKQVLTRLLVATRGETEAMFQQIDGDWWNSHRRVPDKFLVLKRNYDLQENRLPTPVPFETMPPYRLTMPEQVGGFRLRDLGELQIYPGTICRRCRFPRNTMAPERSRAGGSRP